jgi:hypothetical protein
VATQILRQIWTALSHLNPNDVRATAEQSVLVGLHAQRDEDYEQIEDFLCPPALSRDRRLEVFDHLFRIHEPNAPTRFDIEIYAEDMPRPSGTFAFHPAQPARLIYAILAMRPNLALPLARLFPPFRQPVINEIVHNISKENAFFSIATALPDIVPSLIELPWAVGQFASDTAFLTANQTRMAFLLAAASNRTIGYREQRNEIGSIMAGAFGWRAIARQLAAKIPFGGGLIPKAAIAYAGTYVAGRALERYYRDGYTYTEQERKEAYESAFETGKRVAGELIESLRLKHKSGEQS